MIILATHKDISQNKSCVISPISWGTKKIQRIVTSTLSAETSALSTSLDQLTWLRLYWAWLLDSNVPWQKPELAKNLPPAISIPTYKAHTQDHIITDCKSLYDLTTRTAIPNCQEFRTQLLARSIKDVLAEGIKLHWVHSGAQLADALTKMMEANFLRETLRQGKYCLHDSDEVLKNRASARNRLKWLKTANAQNVHEPIKNWSCGSVKYAHSAVLPSIRSSVLPSDVPRPVFFHVHTNVLSTKTCGSGSPLGDVVGGISRFLCHSQSGLTCSGTAISIAVSAWCCNNVRCLVVPKQARPLADRKHRVLGCGGHRARYQFTLVAELLVTTRSIRRPR